MDFVERKNLSMLKFLKRLDLIFFYLFIISIPFEKRHVFETLFSRFDGQFIEWGAAAFYLSDIFLTMALAIWFGKLFFAKIDRSSQRGNKLSEVSTKKERLNRDKTTRNIIILFTFFLICGLISTLLSDFVKLSLYHIIKLLEFGLLFFYIIKNINTAKKIIFTLFCFIGTGFMQAILGILQYLKQSSLGLKMFGEVDLAPTIQNVAKIDVNGQKFIRAYGTFSHSNVLAGFLFVAIIFTLIFVILILHQRSISANLSSKVPNVPRGTFLSSQEPRTVFHEEHFKVFGLNMPSFVASLPFFIFILCILFLGLLLTFSRTVWLTLGVSLSFIIIFLYLLLLDFIKPIIRFFSKAKLAQFSSILALVLFVILCLVIFWPQIFARTTTFDQYGDVTISGRALYTQIAFKMIEKHPFFGVGPGIFVVEMAAFTSTALSWWQLQPVHNVYLLILAEFGILGFGAFLVFLCYIFSQIRKVSLKVLDNLYIARVGCIAFSSIIFGFLIIMFFDHYLWTIQQGVLIFWLVLGLWISTINIFRLQKSQKGIP